MTASEQGPMTFLSDSEFSFGIDQDTGIVWMDFSADFGYSNPLTQQAEAMQMPIRIGVTPEIARSLLRDLPHLRSLLEKASEGPAKPDFLQ